MKNKKTSLRLSLLLAFALITGLTTAQMVGTDAYMKGNNVEIGIRGLGGFEGVDAMISPPLPGMHLRSSNNMLGFAANPQLNSWTTFDGDFFTPGSPENGWGFEIGTTGGISQGNNCAYIQEIPGAITSWSYSTPQIICQWEGDANSGTDLHFKIKYELQDNDLYYITTVTITNNTIASIPELYYYRNLDPDNNEEISFDYTTQNTIISQPICCTYAHVSATSILPATQPMSYFAFLTDADTNWRASYGGFSNRDGSDLWNGIGFTQSVGASNFADEAIAISYRIQNLAAGDSASFKFCSVFDDAAVADAIAGMGLGTTFINDIPNLQNVVSIYPNPFTDNTTIAINKFVSLKNAEMHVYDVLGKEVASILDIQTHEFKLEKNKLPIGMYLYKLINNGAEIGAGKLVVK